MNIREPRHKTAWFATGHLFPAPIMFPTMKATRELTKSDTGSVSITPSRADAPQLTTAWQILRRNVDQRMVVPPETWTPARPRVIQVSILTRTSWTTPTIPACTNSVWDRQIVVTACGLLIAPENSPSVA